MEKFIPEIKYTPVDHDPFVGSAIECTIPSTEAQREVFIASQMGTDASCAYNESVSLELRGQFNRDAMESAFGRLIERHEALRGCMSPDGLRVIILGRSAIRLEHLDLSSMTMDQRTKELELLAERDMTMAFDLLNGPIFRATLVKLGAEEHLLRLTGHHVLVDGWSLGIMMADISKLYSGTSLDPATPFGEFALAVIDHRRSPEHGATERYWLDQFKGGAVRLDLPTDRPRPRMKTYNGNRIDIELDAELTHKLKALATRTGSSLVTMLLTCYEMLIHHITGQSDIVVGLPAAGQNDFGMKHLVGHCVNLLALRSHVDDERSFLEHVKERRTAVLDASDHQKYTFGTLVRKLNVPREPGRIPLVPVVFNIDMNMDDGVAFTGLKHRFISNARRFENFEVFLNATGSEKHLTLEWSYNSDLFDETTVHGWMSDLRGIIERAHEAPTQRIATLLAPPPATDAPLPPRAWSGGPAPYPKVTMDALFDRKCDLYPDRIAVEIGNQRVTYAELRKLADTLAAELLHRGLRQGEPVGICLDRSIATQTAMLATLKAGGCYVPYDLTYPEERVRYMLNDANPRFMLTHRHLVPRLPGIGDRAILLDTMGGAEEGNFQTRPLPKPTHDLHSAAYIMYTSGSTGEPKGVVVPHRGVVRLIRDQNYMVFSADQVYLQMGNLCFDASTFEIWGALLNGAKLVIQPQTKPTMREVADVLRTHKVTTVLFPTGLFNLLVDEQLDALRGLKHLVTGGDTMSPTHARKVLRELGPDVLVNAYGPTENSVMVTCQVISGESQLATTVPIGRPIANTEAYILDDAMRPVPIGTSGELYAGGDGVALGYWQRPELTEEKFVADPFSGRPNAKLYRTGDLARWREDGTIEFLGRADTQVKLRGFRIELGEVESALGDLEVVKDTVVIVRQDTIGDKKLVCYVVPVSPQDHDNSDRRMRLIQSVRDHLQAKLPAHMVPSDLVALASMPLTANGKVDRKALPAPIPARPVMRAEHVAPRNMVEQELCTIWANTLGVENIGIHDNFFEIGGHSLTGIQLLGKVEQHFGKAIEFKQLFMAPTVSQMALLIDPLEKATTSSIVLALQPKGQHTPMVCIHGDEANALLPKYLGTEQPFYAITHQGEDGHRIRYKTVETIASYYIAELEKALPNRTYQLCGYSFGGLVAYEMARQLTASGKEVPMVTLLDTFPPDPFKESMLRERKFHEPLKAVVLRGVIGMVRLFKERLPVQLRNFAIINTYDRATAAYSSKTYSGRAAIIKAMASPGASDMGWKDLVRGELIERSCPGDHYSMIKDPLVAELAQVMTGIIRKADERKAQVI